MIGAFIVAGCLVTAQLPIYVAWRWPVSRTLAFRLLSAMYLLAIAAFCLFGYLASGELSREEAVPWKLGYGSTSLVSAIGAVLSLLRNPPEDNTANRTPVGKSGPA